MAYMKRLKFCVNNEWRESSTGKYMPVMNPSLGEQIAEAPCCTQDEVDSAVKAAATVFPGWADTPIPQRIQLMFCFKALLDTHLDELAELLATEMGKVLAEAKGDVLKAIEVVECACASHYLMQGDTCMNVAPGYDTVSYREPLGVFVGIAPYNFPAMIPMGWMLPFAITTGNTFVLEAASMVPQTSSRMLELLIEAGLPKGVVNLVTCSRDEADSLLSNPLVKGITFVGSTAVGLHIYSTAAAAGKRVQTLCEAKNHALVMEDCVLERTVAGIINSTYGCAGQRCMALPVVVVQESIADQFVALLKQKAMELKLGAAYLPESQLGPLVSAAQKQSVENWIQRGVDEGAQLVLDGRGAKVAGCENGYFVGPTIFDHVKPEHAVGNEEIFGPVTTIKRVKDFEEGLAVMNANRCANGSCIYTSSGRHAREFSRRTHAGMVGINVGIPVPFSIFPFTG
ncbi:MAG: CoA-acylating methylmalonate-semialdehyde dehydrogenase, partial [Propionivibrio sp.]